MTITPEFLFDFESNMRAITEDEYGRMVGSGLWWKKIARTLPSQSKKERIAWLLSTAMIQYNGRKGGNIQFDELVSTSTEYESLNAGTGLKLDKNQLTDLDGNGIDASAKWSSDIGAYMAYWPQKQTAKLILNGETGLAYDGQPFFSSAHPYNPFNAALGTFKNVFTGGASGAYPGACPIDDSVSVEVALNNLAKAIAYIETIKMPNGEDPRFLKVVGIACPPRMAPRVQQLTNAKFIAQAASSGGGSGDVEAMIKNWGMAEPIKVTEFGANFTYPLEDGTSVTGSDTTYYLICQELSSTQLGGVVYVEREAFQITYYTGSNGSTGIDAYLDRAREFEWHCQGRNVAAYGHPYTLFKCKPT
jgi:hypothetical protein